MKKSIKLHIAEPCHENWDKMSTVEKGRHCNVCSKNVIDFTDKSDEEIYRHVTQHSNICGRFQKTQLNREIKLERATGFNLKPYAASLLLPLSLMSNMNTKAANTLSKTETTLKSNVTSLGIGRFSESTKVRSQITTIGTIVDTQGNPLKNVRITSNETEATTWTGKDGSYKIVTLNNETLSFYKKGYIKKVEMLSHKSATVNLTLLTEIQTITPKHQVLGRIAVRPEISNNALEQKQISFEGTVSDENGPLPGVTVIIKGTAKGTLTDFDGNYKIEALPKQILQFSAVGFLKKEITLSTISNKIDLKMDPDYSIMGEMVIMGGIGASYDEPPVESAKEKAERKRKQKIAAKNTREFQRIKHAEKKAARKAKRGN